MCSKKVGEAARGSSSLGGFHNRQPSVVSTITMSILRTVRWGMIGCGEVAEVKSGPGFQKANGSALVAVMRRDRARAEDFATRHGIPRVHSQADALIDDPEVDAVYVATPPSSHCELALRVAGAGKPCLVEKPMAINHTECIRMVEAFRRAGAPLWVAYYRRALPRFLKVRALLESGVIGRLTSVHVRVHAPLSTGERARAWRFDPAIAGGGLFLDLGSHCFDLLDFLVGPISAVEGFAVNSGRAYTAEDVTGAVFRFAGDILGTGIWNFNAPDIVDQIVFTGSDGELKTPVFTDSDISVVRAGKEGEAQARQRAAVRDVYRMRNPLHVHQPLIQTIVDELLGRGTCPSTGETGARSSWVMDRCLTNYNVTIPPQLRLSAP
jgi:1,5-anhydro-D-fructose reductase (1,5-anhydro-D-mannitol-forming)